MKEVENTFMENEYGVVFKDVGSASLNDKENITYVKEILTILDDNIVIGYMARREVIFGIVGELLGEWVVTTSITNPSWHGRFSTRALARSYLQKLRKEEK